MIVENAVLEKLQFLELKIAKEIRRICEKNEIPYFLTAGSCLGAVRHGGFIPWDDDIDIGMLRNDYERFLEACKEDLGDEFFLQTWDTDPEFPFSYAKVRLNGTMVTESFSKDNKSKHKGVFVDIFPYDNVPDSPILRKKQAIIYAMCKRLLWIKKGMGANMKEASLKQKIKYYMFFWFSHIFAYEKVKHFFQKSQTKYNRRPTAKLVIDSVYGYAKDSLERRWVTDLAPIVFENEEFLTHKEKESFLEHYYGDYMTPPPEDKRGGHEMLAVDFGSYT